MSLTRDFGCALRDETQTHNITLESEIILIDMLLSHETQIHNITLESVIIMIGVFLGEKKSNEKAV